MRNLIVLFLLSFLSLNSFGQELNKYFAQGHFNTTDQALIKSVEQSIKEQPGIWMVRIDPTNGNVLVFTTELPFWTKEEFVMLFGMHSELLNGPFIGIVRQDDFKAFPFDDCE